MWLRDLSSRPSRRGAISALDKRSVLLIGGLALWLSACSEVPTEPPRPSPPLNDPLRWTDAQRTAYEQCLQDNMAVATAWEAIEQGCKDQVAAESAGNDGPLTAPNP